MTEGLVVLSESDGNLEQDDDFGTDMVPLARAARVAGWPIQFLGGRLRAGATALLERIPAQQRSRPALWSGHIPPAADYAAVHTLLSERGLDLLNAPAEHARALLMDEAYPRLQTLTAETVIVRSVEECDRALAQLGLPVFIKGNLFSRKHLGWNACVAQTAQRAHAICDQLWSERDRCREGKILIRRVLPLRRIPSDSSPFPPSREYRVFVYRNVPVGHGYYWPFLPPLAELAPEEETAMLALAVQASERMEVPFLCVDVAQLEDETWKVIETGDPQFSGLSLMDPLRMLTRLSETIGRLDRWRQS